MSSLCRQLQKVEICFSSLLLPEHLAGEGLQRWIQAHLGGDLPAGGRTHDDTSGLIGHGGIGCL